MQSEKRLFLIKNILTLLLFSFVYYSITHNQVVQPNTKQELGYWTIEKAQSQLLFGLASHNYLILRNSSGLVEKELHGTPSDDAGRFIRVTILPNKTLKVFELETPLGGDRRYRPSAITLFKGDEKETKEKWNEALPCADEINKQKLPYPEFGVKFEEDTVNSNSVATTLLYCMSLPSPRVGLFTPGSDTLIRR